MISQKFEKNPGLEGLQYTTDLIAIIDGCNSEERSC